MKEMQRGGAKKKEMKQVLARILAYEEIGDIHIIKICLLYEKKT